MSEFRWIPREIAIVPCPWIDYDLEAHEDGACMGHCEQCNGICYCAHDAWLGIDNSTSHSQE